MDVGINPWIGKARGAYFTPPDISQFMVRWALRSPNDQVLEPSCGSASFLAPAGRLLLQLGARKSQLAKLLSGIDIHEPSLEEANHRLAADGLAASLRCGDFFDDKPQRQFDAVIGNPPFRDRTGHFQKNLTNRRGDMLMEAVTLHRRFPYATLGGLFIFDREAANDATARRRSTFTNAHARLRLFTGRNDPAGRDEQFERFYIALLAATPDAAEMQAYEVGKPEAPVPFDQVIEDLLKLVAERNPDFYELEAGNLNKL